MATDLSVRVVRAGAWVETSSGQRIEVNLVDNPNIRDLVAEITMNQSEVELSPEETGYAAWRQVRPGPHKFARIVLDGMVSESHTERAPTPVRLVDDKTRAALIALGWREPEEER